MPCPARSAHAGSPQAPGTGGTEGWMGRRSGGEPSVEPTRGHLTGGTSDPLKEGGEAAATAVAARLALAGPAPAPSACQCPRRRPRPAPPRGRGPDVTGAGTRPRALRAHAHTSLLTLGLIQAAAPACRSSGPSGPAREPGARGPGLAVRGGAGAGRWALIGLGLARRPLREDLWAGLSETVRAAAARPYRSEADPSAQGAGRGKAAALLLGNSWSRSSLKVGIVGGASPKPSALRLPEPKWSKEDPGAQEAGPGRGRETETWKREMILRSSAMA
ncbi:uncharacterized protein [Notamacropus eugenii]|uniref:uncharacterized protein n=1 Tax=Notamacropus eugenii TaxID=9315 RepID=UPI003B67FDB7